MPQSQSIPDLSVPTQAEIARGVINRVVLPAVAVVLVVWNFLFLVNSWVLMPANDFGRVLYSARCFLDGQDMYAWNHATPAKLEGGLVIDLYNMNPPHLHVLFLPLAAIPDDVALGVWWVINGLCLIWILRRILSETQVKLSPDARRFGLVALLAFSGTTSMVATAQLSFVLLVPITLMWQAARRGYWSRAGLWLGLALSVKPFLAVVLAYFAFRGRLRAAASCLATAVLCFAVGLAIFGWNNCLSWEQKLAVSENWAWLPMNASLNGMLARTFADSVWYVPLFHLPLFAVWGLWLVAGGLMGLVSLGVTSTGNSASDVDRDLTLLLTVSVLLSPLGWIYYLWLILPPLAGMLVRGWPGTACREALPRWVRVLLVVVFAGYIWPIVGARFLEPNASHLRARSYSAMVSIATLTIGNIYCWGLAAFWVCLVWSAHIHRRERARALDEFLPPLAPEDYRISAVLPVYSETDSVRHVVEGLLRELGPRLEEILIIQSPRSSDESRAICRELAETYPQVQVHVQQNNPGLGHAVREGFARVRGNVVLNIDSDGEMELETVSRLLAEMGRGDFALVAASRWSRGGGFTGYGGLKFYLNWCFQQVFRWLFWTPLHDLTYGFKAMRAELVHGIAWEGTLHEIACETTLKPVRLGVRVSEVPSRWTARVQGKSKNTFWRNFRYVRMAWAILAGGVSLSRNSSTSADTPRQCPAAEVLATV
jgi:glycosyl transferase family 87/glycosyl transferase family 2